MFLQKILYTTVPIFYSITYDKMKVINKQNLSVINKLENRYFRIIKDN